VLAELRASGDIGDDAFHAMEEELDWTEMYIEERLGWNNPSLEGSVHG
jgi:hypothetical protein